MGSAKSIWGSLKSILKLHCDQKFNRDLKQDLRRTLAFGIEEKDDFLTGTRTAELGSALMAGEAKGVQQAAFAHWQEEMWGKIETSIQRKDHKDRLSAGPHFISRLIESTRSWVGERTFIWSGVALCSMIAIGLVLKSPVTHEENPNLNLQLTKGTVAGSLEVNFRFAIIDPAGQTQVGANGITARKGSSIVYMVEVPPSVLALRPFVSLSVRHPDNQREALVENFPLTQTEQPLLSSSGGEVLSYRLEEIGSHSLEFAATAGPVDTPEKISRTFNITVIE